MKTRWKVKIERSGELKSIDAHIVWDESLRVSKWAGKDDFTASAGGFTTKGIKDINSAMSWVEQRM